MGEIADPDGEGGVKVVHGSGGSRPLDRHDPSLAATESLLARESSLARKGAEPVGHASGTGGRGLSGGGGSDARKHFV